MLCLVRNAIWYSDIMWTGLGLNLSFTSFTYSFSPCFNFCILLKQAITAIFLNNSGIQLQSTPDHHEAMWSVRTTWEITAWQSRWQQMVVFHPAPIS